MVDSGSDNSLEKKVRELKNMADQFNPFVVKGLVTHVVGTVIKGVAPSARIGELCYLKDPQDKEYKEAEVVGITPGGLVLVPLTGTYGISTRTEIFPTGHPQSINIGPHLLGRVINGLGQPIDHGPSIEHMGTPRPVMNFEIVSPMKRALISQPFELGIRAIDGVITCARGQRMGVFAGAGVGKSTLMGMIVNGCEADVCVVGLVGERGREVREFIEHDLGPEGLKRSVVVIATSDRPSIERMKAAHIATAVAEYFRDQGKNVVLLMDSITRFARALREIGLAAGEPPARRGFPPSVFSELPKLLERSGNSDKGSITAFYTVLVEGDDMSDPIADEVRSILDGHIVLSRKLAEANHYPAIDVLASKSRVMDLIVPREHTQAAGRLRSILSKYNDIELLVRVGEFQRGNDSEADYAMDHYEAVNKFLCQDIKDKRTSLKETLMALRRAIS